MQSSSSPTLTGFRFMFRRPALGLAEIAWRWSFGFAAFSVLAFSFLEFLNTLPVSREDMLLFRSRQGFLISQAIAHILRGSAPRVVDAVIVLAFAMAVGWIAIASLGRSVTLRAIEGYLGEEAVTGDRRWHVGSLAGLNFLRVAFTLAAGLGIFGAWLIASTASSKKDASSGAAILTFLVVLFFVWVAWAVMNWLLSFASVFVVGQGEDAFGAIAAVLRMSRARVWPVLAASTWFGLAHVAAFGIAGSVLAFPLAFAGVLPPRAIWFSVLLIALVYFVIADFLYMGRLAAYVAIVEGPEPSKVLDVPPQVLLPASASSESRIDADELILSDFGPGLS